MNSKIKEDLSSSPGRKRAAVLMAAGGYVNTGIVIVQGLLLVPLYLHYIGAHTYGLWLASGGILGMLILMNFGISSMLIQRVSSSYGQQNFEQTGAYFFNGMVVYLFICLLFGLVSWVVSVWIPAILKITGEQANLLRYCFQVAVIAMVISIFNECLRSFSQALLRPVVPMVGMAIGRIIGIAVTIWMLFDDFGLLAIPIGMLIAEGVIFIVNLFNAISLFKKLSGKIWLDRKIIKEYVQIGPALFMAQSGNALSQQSEPLLITMFIGPEVTTAYMITRKAADLVFLMINVLYGTIHSSFSHLAGEKNNEKIQSIASKLLLLVFISSLIGFASYVGANQVFVTLWVGEEFVLGQEVIFFIGISFFARSLRNMVWQLLKGLGDFTYTSAIIALEGVGRVGLAVLLLIWIGVVGVPCALVFFSVLSFVILGLRLKKILLIKIDFGIMIRFLLSIVALFIVSILIAQSSASYESWGMFVFYATWLLGLLIALFSVINFRMCMVYVKGRC